ncbi:hypothetical protein AGMMS50267_10620 [Spirochaetia bacterium]|nr:hypothetical protein AGMMS50267_10620 [Spirochaetia bacterium]
MKKLIALLCLCMGLQGIYAQQKILDWSLALLNDRTGESLPFATPVNLKQGDRYRFLVETNTDCFCYVVGEVSGDDMVVLRAQRLRARSLFYSDIIHIPSNVAVGSETFYIVISLTEQKPLLDKINVMQKGGTTVRNRRNVMNEIHNIRREISRFRETPETPVLMGGASRGVLSQIPAVHYSGLDTYVKVITINH